MQAHDERPAWYRSLHSRRTSPRLRGALVLLAVIIVAAILRIPGLAGDPPGFRHEEAGVALAAQQIERGFFPIYFRDDTTAIEPAFVYAANLTGQLAGWGVDGPRLAAALLGIATAAGCALWFGRAMGTAWGLAGGLLVATSFWQIAFSRQAVPSITMAAVGVFGLWALWHATERRATQDRQTLPSGWYGLAGLLFGIGIYTDVAMRAVIPVALGIGIFFLLKRGYLYPAADWRGLLLGGVVMLLVAAPLISYFWQEPAVFRQGINNLGYGGSLVTNTRATFDALLWSGSDVPAHTRSGRAVLDPVLAIWGVIGLLVAFRNPLHRLHAVALIWLAGFLLTAIIIAPGRHDQMLALTPVLFLLPLLGMRAVLNLARPRGALARGIALGVIILSLAGSASWSMMSYVNWTTSGDTYRAFAGDVRDALEALPDDNMTVYVATGDNGRIVRYLAPERPRRDFDNPRMLPLPDAGPAYIVVPLSSRMPGSLTAWLEAGPLVASGTGPERGPAFEIRLVDDRIREALPYAVPGVFFENGPVLVGYDITATPIAETPEVEVLLVYRVPRNSAPFTALARLIDLATEAQTVESTTISPARDATTPHNEIILTNIVLPFPETPDNVADLHTAIQTEDGTFLVPVGPNVIVYDDVWALLNAIGYLGPSP